MQEKFPNGTAPQDGEEQRLYENLRNWDDEIINQKMEDLGIPNVKLTSKRKYILGMIDSLADIDTKKFFFRNSDFMEIANISKAPFMETIKYFSKLGIIKRVSGVRGKASQYQFNEKNLKKLPLENQTLNTKKNQTLNGVSPSVLGDSSEYGLGKGSGQKQSVENQPPHTHTQSHIQSQLQKQLQSHLQSQLQEQLQKQLYSQKQMEELGLILSDNNAKLIENINTIVQTIINTIIQLMTNTKDETIEEFKKLYTSIGNITKVQLEHNTKLDKLFELIEEKDKVIEGKDKLINELQAKLQSSSMDNKGKSNGVVQEEVNTKVVEELQCKIDKLQEDSNSKVIEESDSSNDINKSSSKSCCEVQYPSSITFQQKENELIPNVEYTKELEQEPSMEETKESPRQEQTPKVVIKTVSKTTHQEDSNPKNVETSKAEEQKQLQELKETLKPLLENFNEIQASEEHEMVLNEIRKAYTTKGYSQKVLQPFLDFATAYNFYAEKRDVMVEMATAVNSKC